MTNKKRLTTAYIILSLLTATVFVLSLSFGSASLSFSDIINGIKGENRAAEIILKNIRLPRSLGAMLAGAALATAGTVLQSVTQNDLCAPNIIGVNSGAGFGVILTLCFFPSLWAFLPLSAFVGALISCSIVLGISFYGGNKTKGSSIVLSGVAVSSLLSAGISFFSLRYPDILSSYTAFSIGGFSGVRYSELIIPFATSLISFIILQLITSRMNIMLLGDEYANTLGINVRSVRIIGIICSASLCASAVSFAGLLGFVGLIVPNIIKSIMGNDMRFNLSLSALFGAMLVTLSDLAGRILFAPTELPAGIIMSLIGAPFFLYLLIIRRHKHGRM